MKIQIEVDKNSFVEASANFLKRLITFSYRWLTNEGEALGYILGFTHFMLFVFLILSVVASHTIYPNFWLQFGLFCIVFIVWLQHVCLKVCVSIIAEKDLTKNTSPFHELFENVFQISTNDFTTYFVVAETVAVGCLGLELISRISMYFQGLTYRL